MDKVIVILLLSNIFFVNSHLHLDWDPKNPAYDTSFYENELDPELCQEQLAYIRSDTMLFLKFIDSGMRIPRGILSGNVIDLGNYMQCLSIQDVGDTNIDGKYCSINVPLNQDIQLPSFPSLQEWPDVIEWPDFDLRKLKIEDSDLIQKIKLYKGVENSVKVVTEGRLGSLEGTQFENLAFTLAVCVPKTCTVDEGITGLLGNLTAIGFNYNENYCRLNNDKPWVPADYVAIVVFSIIGLLTLLSTSYDLYHSKIMKTDPKSVTAMYKTFSVYTNGRRLMTFTINPGALECLDGIRAISMMWVILGHTYTTLPPRINLLDSVEWTLSFSSTWVTAAPIAVDTFFMLSGLLLVYTTAGKFTGMKLLKNLHVFYLNRLLRMFPLLAAGVLIQASFLYRLYDGPLWTSPERFTNNCRNYWWSTLLYFQNFANPADMCLPHSWYLAIDIQMYILSPLILFWVLSGKKTSAWIAMTAGLLSFLIGSSVYVFIKNFPGAVIAPARVDEAQYYLTIYYVNTLTRAAPFFVGMMFGYILHTYRGKKIQLSWFQCSLLWLCSLGLMGSMIYASHPIKDLEYDNQTLDSLVNAYSRSIWAVGVGLMVFACVHGCGGPLNWFFSLQVWKLPSRLSYGMYIFHYPFMYITAGAAHQLMFFHPVNGVFRFFSEVVIAMLVSFVMTLLLDSPFSTIFKKMFGGGPKTPNTKGLKEVKDGTEFVNGVSSLNNNEKNVEGYTVKL